MTASKRNTGSDLAKVDAYQNTPADYDELPDMGDMDLDDKPEETAPKPARGRPPLGDRAKQSILLRLDPEVVTAFKAGGRGWQTRMNDWLGERAPVVQYIVSSAEGARKMRELVAMLRNGDLTALAPDHVRSIEAVERQAAMTEDAARMMLEGLNRAALAELGGS